MRHSHTYRAVAVMGAVLLVSAVVFALAAQGR